MYALNRPCYLSVSAYLYQSSPSSAATLTTLRLLLEDTAISIEDTGRQKKYAWNYTKVWLLPGPLWLSYGLHSIIGPQSQTECRFKHEVTVRLYRSKLVEVIEIIMSVANTQGQSAGTGAAVRANQAAAIRVDGLEKSYGQQMAVRNLSFTVAKGEIFALLGPNGAGKTTTIEILEGYRQADTGTVEVLGLRPDRNGRELKPRIGVMLQQDGVYPALRTVEILRLFSEFFVDPIHPAELLERLGLQESAKIRCRQLSGGQKRRLALALALIGRPELLFLDEPTTGMDPQARRATWDIIQEQQKQGVTVLLTTHLMDEAERLSDRIAIIDGGKLIALDTPAGLTQAQSATSTEVYFTATPGLSLQEIAALQGVLQAREESSGRYSILTADARLLLAELTAWLLQKQADLTELRVGKSTLEDVFLRLTGKEMRQ
jgi:ABC-2 type transport system ATP-binding protein